MPARHPPSPERLARRAFLGLVTFGMAWPMAFLAAAPLESPTPHVGDFEPGLYRGRLGTSEVEVELMLEAGAEDSVEGWYVFLGDTSKILLAGEFDGPRLSLEESRNGKDVSGTWTGELVQANLTGIWRDAQETKELPFALTKIAPPRPQ